MARTRQATRRRSEEEEDDEEEEESDAAYVDVAARSFRFVGFGGDWADRIARSVAEITARAMQNSDSITSRRYY